MAFHNRATAWNHKKDFDQAIKGYDEAMQLDPKYLAPLNNKAWLLATCMDERYRDGKKAVELATKSCELTEWKNGYSLATLAGAYAETGDFDKAVQWEEMAQKDQDYEKDHGDEARERLKRYRDKKPYRQ